MTNVILSPAPNRPLILVTRACLYRAGTLTDTFALYRSDLSRRAIRPSTIGAHMSRALLLALLAAMLLFPSAAHAGPSAVVVSQIYGGGGNAGATYQNDYVELFNAGSGAVDLSGWTVQYA